ncbi:MAG: DUF1611 domain-containing protein [Pseudomonadota bacterium]
MILKKPYLLFLGDARDPLAAKVAQGVAHWIPEDTVGQVRLENCKADCGLEEITIEEGVARGAKTMIVGVATFGGGLSEMWFDSITQALSGGMDVACGLHDRLNDVAVLRDHAAQVGQKLIDVRIPPENLVIGTGAPRTGQRILTIGTDCSVGKMYTSLALTRELHARKIPATFCATGQTGIFIQGRGVALDAVPADFIAGSIEDLVPATDDNHWSLIEGQGSLFHPAFAGVSLGLLHGAQAQHLIMCHAPRAHMRSLPDVPLPDILECIALNEQCARRTCPEATVKGIACDTHTLSEDEAKTLLDELADRAGLPAVDPVRTGVTPLIDAVLA